MTMHVSSHRQYGKSPFYPIFVDHITPPVTATDAFNRVITEYVERMHVAPLRPRPAARGDKVKVTVEGYVDDVTADGRVFITETRRPFPGEYETGTLVIESTQAGVTVVERAPAAPKVGDTITGATLKATPWRRGTIIGGQSGRQYVLHADGRWHALDDRDAVPFYATGDDAVFVVEHAPGK